MRARALAPAVLWAFFIFLTSCTVVNSRQLTKAVVSTGAGLVKERGFDSFWRQWWWLFVKGWHAIEFAILCALLIKGFRSLKWSTALAGLATFVYACSDEWHQTLIPNRGGKWTDVAIDCIGIVVAMLAALLISQRRVTVR